MFYTYLEFEMFLLYPPVYINLYIFKKLYPVCTLFTIYIIKILCEIFTLGLSPDLQSMEQIRRIMRPTDVPDTGEHACTFAFS